MPPSSGVLHCGRQPTDQQFALATALRGHQYARVAPSDVIYADDEQARLLDGASVPRPPPSLAAQDEVVVAVWREGHVGALMLVHFDPADEEDPYSVDVETYVRTEGRWRWAGTGGSDWPTTYGVRPEAGRPALTGFATGPVVGDRWLWTGLAPVGVDRVRLRRPDGTVAEADVEPFTGAFLVALDFAGRHELD